MRLGLFKMQGLLAPLFLSSYSSLASTECSQWLSQIVESRGVKIELRSPARRETVDVARYFGDSEQVFLGIAKGGHWYLWVGGIRIDGGPLNPVSKSSRGISEGYLIHFPDIPKERIQEWKNDLENYKKLQGFSLSCTQAACSALQKGFGISLTNTNRPAILPRMTFETILRSGFEDAEGNRVKTVIYQTSPRVGSLDQLDFKLKRWEQLGMAFGAVLSVELGVLAIILPQLFGM